MDPQVPLPVLASQAVDHGMLPVGRYQVVVRGDRAEVTGARLAQAPIGQLFNVDVSDAFTHTFCNTCLETVGVRRNGEFLDLTMQVRHPFDLANDALPPSASNRRDLWINNVKGILLTDGDQSYFGGAVTLDPRTLGNPDGFTSLLMQPTGFQANAFPYKVFGAEGANLTRGNFDASVGWDLHRDDPTGFNVLANGQTGQATYRLRIQPGETLVFDLVLTASYSVSAANRTQRLTPTHFMPAGAPPEPWKVLAQAPGTLEAGNTASSVNLQLQALDWQHDPTLTVDPNFPDPSNRDGLAVSSRITAVSYSLPAITGEAETPVDLGE
ncbi:MAG TPA: hypothetical protein VEI97_06720, partial [bacterium]|nr:hypothetical protein [bacterium]